MSYFSKNLRPSYCPLLLLLLLLISKARTCGKNSSTHTYVVTGKIKRGAKVAHFNESCLYTRNFVQEVCAPPKLFNVSSTERTCQTSPRLSLCKPNKKTASLFVGRAKRSSVLLWHVASRTNAIYYHSSMIFFSYSLRFSPLPFPSFPSSFSLFPFFSLFKL